MKKTFILLLTLLTLTGCGEKIKTKKNIKVNLLDEINLEAEEANIICSSYNKDNEDYEVAAKIAVYYDNNENIIKIESSELIASENNNILNDFESYYNSNYEKIANYGGYTYDVHQEKKRLVSNVIIDFNTFNTESYIADYPEIADTFNEEFKLTKDNLLNTYNNQNISCEKK